MTGQAGSQPLTPEREAEIRVNCNRWCSTDDPNWKGPWYPIPASPDDIYALLAEVDRLRAREACAIERIEAEIAKLEEHCKDALAFGAWARDNDLREQLRGLYFALAVLQDGQEQA